MGIADKGKPELCGQAGGPEAGDRRRLSATVLESHSRAVEEGPDAYGPPWSGRGSGWLSYISPWPLQCMPNPAARALCNNKVSSCLSSALAFLLLRCAGHTPASGPLHCLFPLPGSGCFLPDICKDGSPPHLRSLIITSERPFLVTLINTATCPPSPPQP